MGFSVVEIYIMLVRLFEYDDTKLTSQTPLINLS
jgi:hypothetical protein